MKPFEQGLQKRDSVKGMSLVVAIFLLLIMSTLAVYMSTIGSTQQLTSVQSVMSARGYYAAQSGIEWAIHRVQNQPADLSCGGAGPAFNLTSGGLNGFRVQITCTVTAGIIEGANPAYSIYMLSSRSSFGVVGSADYVSRTLQASVSD